MVTKRLSRAKAIKEYCKNSCCAGSQVDWQECTSTGCSLHRFRKGKEILGNSTSFTKTTAKRAVCGVKNDSDVGCENE